jgi:uncharacterized protein (DUF433 family)
MRAAGRCSGPSHALLSRQATSTLVASALDTSDAPLRAVFHVHVMRETAPSYRNRPSWLCLAVPLRERAMGQSVELLDRITVNPDQCGGRACVRGMRIRVVDVLDLLAAGLSAEQVVEELPDLEPGDVTACLRFARRQLDNPVLGA